MTTLARQNVRADAPIPTWFGVGGRADLLAEPASIDELRALVDEFGPRALILGDGANLIVDDAGVAGPVLSLKKLNQVEFDLEGRLQNTHSARLGEPSHPGVVLVRVGAGAMLPRLIVECVRRGLGGLEGLGGVPATVGGAARMNAGGAFGEIASAVRAVRGITTRGETFELTREEIPFGYRASGLDNAVITAVDLALTPGDPAALRDRLKEVMAAKKASQPLAESSAGCVFKNPTIAGVRVSAGRLIDEAGCKGMREGSAEVSCVHANFITVEPGGAARDVLRLTERVRDRVADRHGVTLEREIVVWRRDGE